MDIPQATTFLTHLYQQAQDGYVELRCLHVSGDHRHTRRFWRPMPLGTVNQQALRRIEVLNDAGYHIYVRISLSAGENSRKSDIIATPALWVDIDDPTDAGYQRILNMDPPASLINFSGGGWHGYWLLDNPVSVNKDSLPHIERTLDGMALESGGDRKVKDVTRIMRLPGTVNVKPERNRAQCRIVDELPARYRFDDLYEMYSPLGAPPPLRITRPLPREAMLGDIPPYVEQYLATLHPKGERNKTLYVAARFLNGVGKSEVEATNILSVRALGDGLPDHEVQRTIRSAYRDSATPVLPRHMHDFMAAEDSLMDKRL